MSAVNVLVQKDATHILSDCAVYDDRALLKHVAPKVFALPHLGCAVACRGPAVSVPIVASVLAGAASYDDLKHRLPELLRDAAGTVAHVTRSGLGSRFQLFVAGCADAFTAMTHDAHGLSAYTLIPITDLSLAPGDGEIHRAVLDIVGGRTANDIDPECDGLQILEAQRRHRVDLPNGRLAYIIGGAAQLTTVRRGGSIETKILVRWPDKAGQKIIPKGECVK